MIMRTRRAFTLMETLLAVALFGLAAAALLIAYSPVQDALFRLSERREDSDTMELVRLAVETVSDRTALDKGGDCPLPDGRTVRWTATLAPTNTEAVFLVRLAVGQPGGDSRTMEYLRFDPRWLDASAPPPQWLRAANPPAPGGDSGGHSGRGGRKKGSPDAGNAPDDGRRPDQPQPSRRGEDGAPRPDSQNAPRRTSRPR